MDLREKRRAERAGGVAIFTLPNAKGTQMRTYYNEYGEPFRLPADQINLVHYLERGFLLKPPVNPQVRSPETIIGVDDWHGEKQAIDSEGRPIPIETALAAASGGPTATYYTTEGTALALPADPESMTSYLAQGLRLDPPEGVEAMPRDVAIGQAPDPIRWPIKVEDLSGGSPVSNRKRRYGRRR